MENLPYFYKNDPGIFSWPPEVSALGPAIEEASNIAVTDDKGVIVYVNNNFCKSSKYQKEELIGQDLRIVNSGHHSKEYIAQLWATVSSGKTWKGEFRNKAKDGTFFWMDTTIVPLYNKEKKPFQYLAIHYNISAIKTAENKHKELEEKIKVKTEEFSNLLERIGDGFLVLDNNFCYTYANKKIGEMTGRDPGSLIGKNIWEEFPDAVGSLTYHAFQKAMLEKVFVINTDHFEPLNLWQENHIYPSPEGLSVFIRNITEQKRTEQELLKKEGIYKTITSNIPGSVIIILDEGLNYRLIEGDLLEMLGYQKEKLLNQHIKDVLPEERYTLLLPYFNRALNGELVTIETSLNGYDMITRFVPLKDQHQRVYSVMTVGIDITELKKAQKQVLEINSALEKKVLERTEQLERVNKELEAFSYSVAHDLRAPLRALSGYSTIITEDYGALFDAEGKRLLNAIGSNAKKMGLLIDDLLTFSRLGRKEMQMNEVDMNQLVEEVISELNLVHPRIPKIQIGSLHKVRADRTLFKHIMINLVSNAIKYSSKNESAVVEITSAVKNDSFVFSVKDNGVGFDMTFVHKLFGVFQRLHSDEEFEGTGVGLAIVQRIVERHGGTVWAEGKPDEGATFYFSVPGN